MTSPAIATKTKERMRAVTLAVTIVQHDPTMIQQQYSAQGTEGTEFSSPQHVSTRTFLQGVNYITRIPPSLLHDPMRVSRDYISHYFASQFVKRVLSSWASVTQDIVGQDIAGHDFGSSLAFSCSGLGGYVRTGELHGMALWGHRLILS